MLRWQKARRDWGSMVNKYRPLIKCDRRAARTLTFPAAMLAVIAVVLARVPWSLQNPELVRVQFSGDQKNVMVLIGAVASAAAGVFLAFQILSGLGVFATISGRPVSVGALLTTPLGRFGYPKARMQLQPGRVEVRLADEAPWRPAFAYGIQRVTFVQNDATLAVARYVRFDARSRDRLADWLRAQGVEVDFVGDQHVLPE